MLFLKTQKVYEIDYWPINFQRDEIIQCISDHIVFKQEMKMRERIENPLKFGNLKNMFLKQQYCLNEIIIQIRKYFELKDNKNTI